MGHNVGMWYIDNIATIHQVPVQLQSQYCQYLQYLYITGWLLYLCTVGTWVIMLVCRGL